jgi:hypothetical protein
VFAVIVTEIRTVDFFLHIITEIRTVTVTVITDIVTESRTVECLKIL